MSNSNASSTLDIDPFKNARSTDTGNKSQRGGGAVRAIPDAGIAIDKCKQAIKEADITPRACKKLLGVAIEIIEGLRKQHKPEASGTIIRIQDEEEKKAIAKLSSEELVMKLDTKEVIGAKQMTNGQMRVYFAGQDVKEVMETQRGWTTKLAPTAQIASKSYQVLAHNLPLSFDPSNMGHIKELDQARRLYLQGITI
ncbi:hypothetical protein EPUL_006084 [Erysiphe pulchra]|uniref:Uncharacterized protein n=1 Tax=Erysiphe pulchra TaxID=225359 RepID=A0A2S4PM30_9PEZI|nr:hypothetical protein EPUL_006084 [Erysiphe pulchra]